MSYHLDTLGEKGKKDRNISEFVTQGEILLVQVTKEGFGSKGPRLTGIVSFPGKYVVYMPEGGYVGVSQSFSSEEEREQWRSFAEHLLDEKEG